MAENADNYDLRSAFTLFTVASGSIGVRNVEVNYAGRDQTSESQ